MLSFTYPPACSPPARLEPQRLTWSQNLRRECPSGGLGGPPIYVPDGWYSSQRKFTSGNKRQHTVCGDQRRALRVCARVRGRPLLSTHTVASEQNRNRGAHIRTHTPTTRHQGAPLPLKLNTSIPTPQLDAPPPPHTETRNPTTPRLRTRSLVLITRDQHNPVT